ncbi:hypothetical protein BJV85_002429 [Clostridium acetobutylicum]|uniref:Uncharacterized protein n=1 Tax=Clostridium acetobutylicum (strain ATCC 824 / DSM 792 / JCM 1419 / IAM 19013 / LMG 5710 / NBRC 13948 / NRRL B-527 / VKM B-1787 / 2291 / W) TaxID=272562 RepID=Q97IS3_CLOAB|nr:MULTISPECIES: hypothetical protein [Clostridium]AAK79534.1 Hypothetical protein CA_C1567 [Clostridium acetobutylicum ATCC 824]ADZ20619.1 Conserved hypothetical protein [Clostridium acetobutylicum EA 2018]AEI31873.1 hypothetical protein SMB_G1592 [Clostridium acetobutylicum DSM 1731]AWV81222.1 hypothetical protein DK921_14205 [Clostridium acetobutylicum]KHD36306.1 hypothetical protein NL50_11105 [Clostridium acetobutylicum]
MGNIIVNTVKRCKVKVNGSAFSLLAGACDLDKENLGFCKPKPSPPWKAKLYEMA